jgi:hypothetical protein
MAQERAGFVVLKLKPTHATWYLTDQHESRFNKVISDVTLTSHL